ncbi:hypothetical protein [Oceanobacillus sp. FSL H7-0719]|uniref:hypothetical protein n=1 Tax=Oceanobacillus sp. FSL H7-0719 TaxID=2954507 RepID=UPI0032556264
MKKRNIVTAVGAGVIGAGAASYFLLNDKQKMKLKDRITNIFGSEPASTFEKAGHPDEVANKDLADLENAKMVSEGSQFGVQYYSEKREEEQEVH